MMWLLIALVILVVATFFLVWACLAAYAEQQSLEDDMDNIGEGVWFFYPRDKDDTLPYVLLPEEMIDRLRQDPTRAECHQAADWIEAALDKELKQ